MMIKMHRLLKQKWPIIRMYWENNWNSIIRWRFPLTKSAILILTQHLATSFHVNPSSNRHVPMSYHCHVIPPQLLPGLL